MGIRAGIVVLILAGVVTSSLVVERMAFLGYIWWASMRPDILAYMEPTLPISFGLALLTGANGVRKLYNLGAMFGNPMSLGIMALLVPTTLSCFFAVNVKLAEQRYREYLTTLAVLLLMPLFIETADHLKELVMVIAGSVGLLGFKFGTFGVVFGGVVFNGGYGGMLSDNNLVALGFAMTVPLCWYSSQMASKPWLKSMFRIMAAPTAAAVILTNSRGGSIALAVAFLMIAFRAKHKIGIALLLVFIAGGTMYLISDVYFKRMSTLAHVEEESSAASRITHAKAAIAMWKDYPFLGVGFGGYNYAVLSPRYRPPGSGSDLHVVHNSYLSMLVDSGIFAFLIYCTLIFGTIISMGRTLKKTREVRPDLLPLPLAIQTSLAVFAVGSTFYSCQRFDVAYMLILAAGIWKMKYKELIEMPQLVQEPQLVPVTGHLKRTSSGRFAVS